MTAMIGFVKTMMKMPIPWRIWVASLFTSNMVSVLFFPRIEAIVVFVFLMLGGLFQTLIFSKWGFVKLLGLGHFHWIPMIIWIYTRMGQIQSEPIFYKWIIVMFIFNVLSLVIDGSDVVRYLKGERRPTITN